MIPFIVTILCMVMIAACALVLFGTYLKEIEENGSKTSLSEVLGVTSLILAGVVLLQFMYSLYWLISVGVFK